MKSGILWGTGVSLFSRLSILGHWGSQSVQERPLKGNNTAHKLECYLIFIPRKLLDGQNTPPPSCTLQKENPWVKNLTVASFAHENWPSLLFPLFKRLVYNAFGSEDPAVPTGKLHPLHLSGHIWSSCCPGSCS